MDYNAFGVSRDCRGILAYAGGEKNGKRGSDREGVVTVESWWGPGRARTAPVRWLVGLGVRFGRLLRVRFGRLVRRPVLVVREAAIDDQASLNENGGNEGQGRAETIPNQGSRALIIQRTCRGPFSAVSN